MDKDLKKFNIVFGLLILIGIIIYSLIPVNCVDAGMGGEVCESNLFRTVLNIFLGFGMLFFVLVNFLEKITSKKIENPSDKSP